MMEGRTGREIKKEIRQDERMEGRKDGREIKKEKRQDESMEGD
jgi:hypothetical protein